MQGPAVTDTDHAPDVQEIVRRVRHIELVTTRLAVERFTGQYHSAFKGRGVTFEEVRPYQPGDDVRAIDWNVTARTDLPHVKLFAEERELTVLLVVDASASGRFGTRAQRKRDLGAEIAAVLAFSAVRNHDRVGLLCFSDRVERYLPPDKGRRHVLRVVRDVLALRPTGRGTDLRAALELCAHVQRRRAVAFLISDFIGGGDYQRALRLVARRHDLVPVVLSDPVEDELPDVGLALWEDLETGEEVLIDTGGPAARGYRERVRRGRDELRRLCRRLGLEVIEVSTDRPYLPALLSFFRARERLR